MSTTDLRGVLINSTDPTVASNPNPGIAIKAPCLVATTGTSITLAGLQTIDGHTTLSGDRVLVKDQLNPTQNGIYNAATGNWTRAVDAQSNTQWAQGTIINVSGGGTNAGTLWQQTTAGPIVLGTSNLVFSVLSAISTSPSFTIRYITVPTTPLTVNANDTLIEIYATVGSITLPDGASRTKPVTIVGAAAGVFGAGCPVTVASAKNIGGQATFTFSQDFSMATFVPLTSGAWAVQ